VVAWAEVVDAGLVDVAAGLPAPRLQAVSAIAARATPR
jgi:hypothetical protein